MENNALQEAFGAQADVAPVNTANEKKAEKSAVNQALKQDFIQKLQQDTTLTERLNTLSDSIEVVNTLGCGTGGGLIRKEESKNSDKRELEATPKIVGYSVKNVGETPITYQTEVWSLDEATGKYVASAVEKVMNPGDVIYLTRRFMTTLCARPEISFVLKNGSMISGSSKKNKTTEEKLSSFYFKFAADTGLAVNSDAVKVSIDEEGADGKRVVKPEFVETFGYINNPEDKSGKRGKKPAKKISTQALLANYAMSLIEGKDILA